MFNCGQEHLFSKSLLSVLLGDSTYELAGVSHAHCTQRQWR